MILVFGLVGLAVGSFLNVCIDRLPQGHSIMHPPSRCAACGRPLAPRDLIPLLSYVLLRGRCRHCQAPIPRRLPLVELTTGLLFALLYWHYGPTPSLVLATVFTSFLIVISAVDLDRQIVPNRIVYPGIAVAFLAAPLRDDHGIVSLLTGGILGFAILLAIALAWPGGMGMGDVKLVAFIGLAVGAPAVLVALFLSFVLGGIVGAGLLVVGMKGRKDAVPFAPYLAAGGFVAMLYGPAVWRWYLSLWQG